jgi:hypothetical protein
MDAGEIAAGVLEEAFSSVARRVGAPYVVDGSVDRLTLNRRIRLATSHLTGLEVFRWLARLADLAAVRADGIMIVADPAAMPVVWKARGESVSAEGEPPARARESVRWREAFQRRADIEWVDMPLSAAARQISTVYGVDLIFDPEVLRDQGIVHLLRPDTDLPGVLRVMAEQLDARIEFVEGAFWVRAAGDEVGESGFVPPSWSPEIEDQAKGEGVLAARVRLDSQIRSWVAFGKTLSEAGEARCRVEIPEGSARSYPGFEAAGRVADILEAARLLGHLTWRLDGSDEADTSPVLKIRIASEST